MNRLFYEIVIEGPFMLVKGFVTGFLAGIKPDGKYFFHRKEGIRRDTLSGFLKELFELDNYVHLCLEGELIEPFKQAVQQNKEKTGMKIKSTKKIKSASFTFAYEFFNEALALKAKELLSQLPEGVELINYSPYEKKDEAARGVEAYAPLHDFTSRAKGTFQGAFEGIMKLYLDIKRSKFSESVICDDVRLELE